MMDSSYRPIYLIVYNRRMFNAHWALFVPSSENKSVGTRIHAVGDVRNGFVVEIIRNYDLSATTRVYQDLLLGNTSGTYVKDYPAHLPSAVEYNAKDQLENVVLSIPPPGPSLRNATALGPRTRVEVQDCQWWLKRVVDALIEAGILGSSAASIIAEAPKH